MQLSSGYKVLSTPDRCRAFVTHAIRSLDYDALSYYAEDIIPIHHRWVFPDECEIRENSVIPEAKRVFAEFGGFNPDRDYLVMVGDVFIGSAIMWDLSKTCSGVTLLRYDNQFRRFIPFKISGKQNHDKAGSEGPGARIE